MEEMPLPGAEEHAQMTASLEQGQAAIAAGKGRDHNPQTFVAEMSSLRAGAKRSSKA
jgi:hypothetical protein